MNTINTVTPIKANSSFDLYDKAMDIVDVIFNEEPLELTSITVVKNVCKIKLPIHVPLKCICDRDDVSVNLTNDYTVITVH